MSRTRILSAVAFAFLAAAASAQDKKSDEPPLLTASGVVDKADKESLTVKPRGPDGRFQKTITLKVTGTSKVAVLSPRNQGGKVVLTQREAEAKDLTAGQTVAVIYSDAAGDGPVLLTAVAHPVSAK